MKGRPDHPSKLLVKYMNDNNLDAVALSKKTLVATAQINKIINKITSVGPKTATKLSANTDISYGEWIDRFDFDKKNWKKIKEEEIRKSSGGGKTYKEYLEEEALFNIKKRGMPKRVADEIVRINLLKHKGNLGCRKERVCKKKILDK